MSASGLIDDVSSKMRLYSDKAYEAYPDSADSEKRHGYMTACEDFYKGKLPKMEYGWLVEAKIQDHNGPYYLCVSSVGGHQFEWKPDHKHAIRFCREQDAVRMRDAVRQLRPDLFPYIVPMAQAVQHAWSDQ